MTVKAINDSARPNGIISILLVFDVYLQLIKIDLLSFLVTKRAKVIYVATKKVRRLYIKRQVKNVLAIYNSFNTKNILNLPFS
jgi:hypothetical protein